VYHTPPLTWGGLLRDQKLTQCHFNRKGARNDIVPLMYSWV